ncbi:MAG: phage holin family protein [Bacteroidia bacterium]|jgi:hypothetical protein
MSEPSFFSELKQLITDYFEARIALLKINVYEKIARVTAVLFSSIIIALILFFLVFFLSISAGFYFGSLLNSNAWGFLIVFGFYLILLVVILIFRKKLLEKYIIDKVIQTLFEKEESND